MKLYLSLLLLILSQLTQPLLAKSSIEQVQKFAEFVQCKLLNGQVIKPCNIGYRTFGQLNNAKDNAILVPTWYTGTSAEHRYLIDDGLINVEQYFVIIVDAIGNGVSSSPSNSPTQANQGFPKFNIADMVDTQHRLITELFGIKKLYAVVGLSMGGMQAFEWAARYPDFMHKTVAAIGSPQLAAFDLAFWKMQLYLFEWFRQCQCEQALSSMTALRFVSKVPEVLSKQLARENVLKQIELGGKQSQFTLAKSWDYQRQVEAMLKHDIARDSQHDLGQIAKQIQSKFLIVVGADDRIVTPSPAKEIALLLNAKLVELDAGCGHQDPWCDSKTFTQQVKAFLTKD